MYQNNIKEISIPCCKNKNLFGYIYATYYKGDIVYIGQTRVLTYAHSTRYKGSGLLLKKYIEKYGANAFFTAILDIAFSLEELNEKEIYYIKKYNTLIPKFGGKGYNISSGGNGVGTYKKGQDNPASSTNMSAEKRKEKAQKGQLTYKRHLAEGKIKTRKMSEEEKKILSVKAKNRWKKWKQTGYAQVVIKKSVLHRDKESERKYALIGSQKAREISLELGNPNAKIWYARDTKGNQYTIKGSLTAFCTKHGLSLTRVRRYLNKGKVPFPRPQSKNPSTLALVGWEFTGGTEFVRKDCKRRKQ